MIENGNIVLNNLKSFCMIRIDSYFSLPTDLANEMREWREFVSGEEYSVDLKDIATGEEVFVRLIEPSEEGFSPHIEIWANNPGQLFERVVGRVVFAMSAHSDNLMVARWQSHVKTVDSVDQLP